MQTIAWIDGGSKKYKILGEKNQEQEDINLPGNLALTYNWYFCLVDLLRLNRDHGIIAVMDIITFLNGFTYLVAL